MKVSVDVNVVHDRSLDEFFPGGRLNRYVLICVVLDPAEQAETAETISAEVVKRANGWLDLSLGDLGRALARQGEDSLGEGDMRVRVRPNELVPGEQVYGTSHGWAQMNWIVVKSNARVLVEDPDRGLVAIELEIQPRHRS